MYIVTFFCHSLRKNGFMNDFHQNSFPICFYNQTQEMLNVQILFMFILLTICIQMT